MSDGSQNKVPVDRAAIAACLIVSFLFGMLHIFSIYVVPLETAFGSGRAAVSFSYSLAIVCLALMVMWGHRFYGRVRPAVFFCIALGLGAVGLVMASFGTGLWGVWLGYGLVFGAANGLGYGFSLQFAARVWPDRAGWAMGLLTAAYAMGASSTPPLMAWVMGFGGWQGAFVGQAALYLVAMPVVWILLRESVVRFATGAEVGAAVRWWDHRGLWLAYGLAVFAGLMVLSQASEIVRGVGATAALATAAPMITAAANLVGSLLGGWAADRVSPRVLLAGVPLGSAVALAGMVVWREPLVMAMGVALIGFFYGATIAAYPAVIGKAFSGGAGLAVYGVVFTAWGAAGVLAPGTAGALFDWLGGYGWALGIAGVLAFVSALMWLRGGQMFQKPTEL